MKTDLDVNLENKIDDIQKQVLEEIFDEIWIFEDFSDDDDSMVSRYYIVGQVKDVPDFCHSQHIAQIVSLTHNSKNKANCALVVEVYLPKEGNVYEN